MKPIKVIVEKHADGYVAYPLGLKGVVVGEGDTYEEALADVKSAIRFHLETFGPDIFDMDSPVLEAFVAEAEEWLSLHHICDLSHTHHTGKAPFVFIDALCTEAGSGFSTRVAGNDWRAISGKYLDSPPLHIQFLLRNYFHDQLCRRAEIILVRTSLSRTEHFIQAHLHTFTACIPLIHSCNYRIANTSNLKGTQMPATLQPGRSEKAPGLFPQLLPDASSTSASGTPPRPDGMP